MLLILLFYILIGFYHFSKLFYLWHCLHTFVLSCWPPIFAPLLVLLTTLYVPGYPLCSILSSSLQIRKLKIKLACSKCTEWLLVRFLVREHTGLWFWSPVGKRWIFLSLSLSKHASGDSALAYFLCINLLRHGSWSWSSCQGHAPHQCISHRGIYMEGTTGMA